MRQMMLRPKWIGALALALLVAAIFAALAQWQISRSVQDAIVHERPTETVLQLSNEVKTGVATPQSATGQRMTATGVFVAGDSVIVGGRIHRIGSNDTGWWVVSHFVTDQHTDLPVVVGWASSAAAADTARTAFDQEIASGRAPTEITGRFLPSDAPDDPGPGTNSQTVTQVAVAQLINIWAQVAPGGTYFGYVINETPQAGLDSISTPAPEQQEQLNLLNVFYGIEWIVFAGFAIFLWWRLVRDAVEREREEAELEAEAEAEGAGEAELGERQGIETDR